MPRHLGEDVRHAEDDDRIRSSSLSFGGFKMLRNNQHAPTTTSIRHVAWTWTLAQAVCWAKSQPDHVRQETARRSEIVRRSFSGSEEPSRDPVAAMGRLHYNLEFGESGQEPDG